MIGCGSVLIGEWNRTEESRVELGVSGASRGRMGQDHQEGTFLGETANIAFGEMEWRGF